MNVIRIATIPVLMLLVSGCVTAPGYDRFFNVETNVTVSCVALSNVVVQVFRTDDELKSAYCSALDNGAILLGQSAWEGPYTDPARAKRRAASVGANLVLVSIGYSHTRTGSMSLPQYHPGSSTTYSTHNSGIVSGYGGSAQYSGNSTTTASSPGYTTYNNIPFSVARYDHWAVFLHQDNGKQIVVSQQNNPMAIPVADVTMIADAKKQIAADPLNPTNEWFHLTIGDKYMAYKHFPEAIMEFQSALTFNKNDLHAMEQIGLAYFFQKQYDAAIDQYNRMLLVEQSEAGPHFYLAQCYYHGKKDVDQAKMHWNTALNILAERNGPYAKYLKGRCHWGLALIFYFNKKSLTVGSDHAYQAGKLFIECDEKESSLQMVDLIKSCDPSSPLATRLTDYIYSKEENAQKSPSPVK